MVRRYNSSRLNEAKEGILGLYLEKLEELRQGKIPTCFESYADFLKEAIPFFPEEYQPKYKRLLEAGLIQVRFLRASREVEVLKGSESERLKTIDNFLDLDK